MGFAWKCIVFFSIQFLPWNLRLTVKVAANCIPRIVSVLATCGHLPWISLGSKKKLGQWRPNQAKTNQDDQWPRLLWPNMDMNGQPLPEMSLGLAARPTTKNKHIYIYIHNTMVNIYIYIHNLTTQQINWQWLNAYKATCFVPLSWFRYIDCYDIPLSI